MADLTGATLPVCLTCGTQYAAPRPDCPVCLDERQYVGRGGQQWTSVAELRADGHQGRFEEQGPGVLGIGSTPGVRHRAARCCCVRLPATCCGTACPTSTTR